MQNKISGCIHFLFTGSCEPFTLDGAIDICSSTKCFVLPLVRFVESVLMGVFRILCRSVCF